MSGHTEDYVRLGGATPDQRRAILEAQARKTHSGLKRAAIFNELAEVVRVSDTAVALDFAEQAATLLDGAASDPRENKPHLYTGILIDNLCQQSRLFLRLGRFDEALQRAQRAKELADAGDDIERRITTLHWLGKGLYNKGRNTEALECYELALSLNERIGDLKVEAAHRHNIGEVLLLLGDIPRAERFLARGLEIRRELGNPWQIAVSVNMMGSMYYFQSDYGKALQYYREYAQYIEESDDIRDRIIARANIGLAQQQLGDYGNALEEYFHALEMSEKNNYTSGIAFACRFIGSVYERLLRYDKALEYLSRALEVAESSGDLREKGLLLQNIGCVYKEFEKPDKNLLALEFFQRALAIFADSDDKRFEALQHTYIGEMQTRLSHYKKARSHVAKGLRMFRELDDKFGAAISLAAAADCERALRRYESAFAFLGEAMALAEEMDSKELQQRIHYQYFQCYRQCGDAEQALKSHIRFHETKQAQFSEESDRRTRNLQVLHELQQKEKEKEIYRLQNAKLAAEVQGQKKELTAQAMYLSQKNEVLKTVMQQLAALAKGGDSVPALKIREVERSLDSILQDEQSWKAFEAQFQAVHPDFVRTITVTYPKLSPTEVKVCALIMLNLSTKESARILNISNRSVGEYRYRIRKKLGLKGDESLANFLARL